VPGRTTAAVGAGGGGCDIDAIGAAETLRAAAVERR
jgi:hypothetical protein